MKKNTNIETYKHGWCNGNKLCKVWENVWAQLPGSNPWLGCTLNSHIPSLWSSKTTNTLHLPQKVLSPTLQCTSPLKSLLWQSKRRKTISRSVAKPSMFFFCDQTQENNTFFSPSFFGVWLTISLSLSLSDLRIGQIKCFIDQWCAKKDGFFLKKTWYLLIYQSGGRKELFDGWWPREI